MPGLDPGIHSSAVEPGSQGNGMDFRVKPGNDDRSEDPFWVAVEYGAGQGVCARIAPAGSVLSL
jgi:hypothetical protein